MTSRESAIRNIKQLPRRKGKSELIRHLKGEKLTRGEAIHAKCFECTAGEESAPCQIWRCPLHPFRNKDAKDTPESGIMEP